MSTLDKDRLDEVFEAFESDDATRKLSAKDLETVESLKGYWDRRGFLTEAQMDLLEILYVKI